MNPKKPTTKYINFKESNATFYADVKKIDIIPFAEAHGYEFRADKSYQHGHARSGGISPISVNGHVFNNVVMVHKDTKDFITVNQNPSGDYFYFNLDNKKDAGDALTFVKNRNPQRPYSEICNDFRQILGSPIMERGPGTVTATPKKAAREPLVEMQFYHGLKALTKPEYLQARGITIDTLAEPVFKGRIYNTQAQTIHKNELTNVAFPYYNVNGITGVDHMITGVEVKNKTYNRGFTAFTPDSKRSLWVSKIDPAFGDKPIDKLIIGESVINCLSYHQLNKEALAGKNVQYASVGGNIFDSQIDMLQRLVDEGKPSSVVLINDKDNAGYTYDLKIVGRLHSGEETDQTFQLVQAEVSKLTTAARATTAYTLDNIDPQKLALAEKKIMDFYLSKKTEDEIEVKTTKQGASTLLVEVTHSPSILMLAQTAQFVIQQKGFDFDVAIERAPSHDGLLMNDWNERLMAEKELTKEDIYKNMLGHKAENEKDPGKLQFLLDQYAEDLNNPVFTQNDVPEDHRQKNELDKGLGETENQPADYTVDKAGFELPEQKDHQEEHPEGNNHQDKKGSKLQQEKDLSKVETLEVKMERELDNSSTDRGAEIDKLGKEVEGLVLGNHIPAEVEKMIEGMLKKDIKQLDEKEVVINQDKIEVKENKKIKDSQIQLVKDKEEILVSQGSKFQHNNGTDQAESNKVEAVIYQDGPQKEISIGIDQDEDYEQEEQKSAHKTKSVGISKRP